VDFRDFPLNSACVFRSGPFGGQLGAAESPFQNARLRRTRPGGGTKVWN
jgi:hypothetical protein